MRRDRLSKSRYMQGLQCPKMLWMRLNMPDEFDESVMDKAILAMGNVVGDLAMGYYGDFVEVPFDHTNFEGMAARTAELLEAGCPVICEATFALEGDLCLVDILRNEPDGVHIVEVKSSTKFKDQYLDDMAYQAWLVGACGLAVKSVSLMHVNYDYVRQGEIDLKGLFTVEDWTPEVMALVDEVPANAAAMRRVMLQATEPSVAIGEQCQNPYGCGYQGWCWRDVPAPSVFDLCGIPFKRALRLYEEGMAAIPNALDAGLIKSPRQLIQARCEAEGLEEHIDREQIASFLDGLSFPLAFLDFETWMPTVPPFDGIHPYQQLPTQYSLHVLWSPAGPLEHREFLAEAGVDPRRAVAEHLVADLPADACILAYNMSFERRVMQGLAQDVPGLARPLLDTCNNLVDLIVPFQKFWYYRRDMGGRYSIKVVLPALFPDDPDLDYHALEGVHNGSEAANAFGMLAQMTPKEAARTREQLLRYCKLDTYAMVRIWQRLVEATGGTVDEAALHAVNVGTKNEATAAMVSMGHDVQETGTEKPRCGRVRSWMQRILGNQEH